MEHRHSRKRSIAGFTMAEVLVTVGIVAILLAVAVPGVIAARANLKMTELDATAREIFLAAQNSLTGHKAAGTLEQVGALSGGDPRFLRDGESGMDALLPLGAIDPTVAGNHYVVRLNLEYATVLDVFYSEEGFGGDLAGKTNEELYAKLYDDPAARKELQVGYYNGGGTEYNRLEQLLSPAIEVINGDELRVNVTVPDYAQYQDKGVKLTVRVETLDGAAHKDFDLTFDSGRASLLLDSLEAGKQFSSLCPGITPGAQIRITATLTAADCLPSSASFETNSLFAGRQGDTALIACGRHLQNLDCGTSGVLGVTAAVQTAEITWPSAFNFIPIESYDLLSYSGNKLPIRDLFINDVQTVKRKSYGLFGDIWYNSSVDPSTKLQISGVRIVNPDIRIGSDDTGTNVGALAGSATDAEITDCLVYLEKAQETADYTDYAISGPGSVGGLIGKASKCTITSSAVGLYSVRGTSDCEYLGGLIGYAEACTITNSYASVDQLGGSANAAVAMFAGQGGNMSVSACYAAGNISANTDGTAINGFMQGGGTTSGESGIRDSYCAVTYYDKDGQPRGADFKINQAFSPAAAGNCAYLETGTAAQSETAAATALDYDALREWEGIGGTALAPELSHPYQAELDGKAYPFPALMLSKDNPIPHYGSWPLPVEAATSDYTMAYYELHQVETPTKDGVEYSLNYGWYAELVPDEEPVINTLDETAGTLIRDGYALLCREQPKTTPTLTIEGEPVKLVETQTVTGGEETYYCYLLPDSVTDPGSDDLPDAAYNGFYLTAQVKDGGKQASLFFSPYFAKSCAVGAATVPDAPSEAYIRTPRHLWYLAELSASTPPFYEALNYWQERDLDYGTYLDNPKAGDGKNQITGDPYHEKIQQSITLGNGQFDGNNHAVSGILLPATGLFRTIGSGGVARNLTLNLTQDTYLDGGDQGYVGALVGSLGGTAENCTVKVLAPLDGKGYYVGLLAGFTDRNSKITDCTVGLSAAAVLNGSLAAGGMAGGATGMVTNCLVDLRGSLSLTGNIAGGLIGDSIATVADCAVLYSGSHSFSAPHTGGLVGYQSGGAIDTCQVKSGTSKTLLSITAGKSFGGLVGYLTNSTIENSHVYSGSGGLTLSGSITAGGLVGSAGSSTVISGCSVRPGDDAAALNLTITAQNVGGLVYSSQGDIKDCFAVATVSGASSAGGFAYENSGSISGSYANCVTSASSAGGFVYINGGTIGGSYSLLSVTGTQAAGGFSCTNSGSISNSYAATLTSTKSGSLGGFSATNSGLLTDCAYLKSTVSGTITAAQDGKPLTYEELVTWQQGGWAEKGKEQTHPYSESLSDAAYPFPALVGLDHYGDWPDAPVTGVGLFYYEAYSDGTFGIYAVGYETVFDGTTLAEFRKFNLANAPLASQDDSKQITDTGYGVFWSDTDSNRVQTNKWSIGSTDLKEVENKWTAAPCTYPGYQFRLWSNLPSSPFTTLLAYKHDNSGHRETEILFSVEPRFAQAIFPNPPDTQEKDAAVWGEKEDLSCIVRTQKQLSAVGAVPDYYFRQTYDIPLDDKFTEISSLSGVYDGNGCSITGLEKPLLGTNSGTLKNLSLFGAIQDNSGGNVGFIRTNSGRLEQVHSAGDINLTISGGSASLGGLVGENKGTVTLCSSTAAVNGEFNNRKCSGYVGGLIGKSGGTIDQSYAKGSVTATGNNSATVYTGGFVGISSNHITDCYTTGTVSGFGWSSYWESIIYKGAYLHRGQFCGYNQSVIRDCYATNGWQADDMIFSGRQDGEIVHWYFFTPSSRNLGQLLYRYWKEYDSIALSQSQIASLRSFPGLSPDVWQDGIAPYPTLIDNPEP